MCRLTGTLAAIPQPWPLVRSALPTLALGSVVWLVLFQTEVFHAVELWNSSTAYNHCWFVLPIAAYLAWDRYGAARDIPLQPMLWSSLLAVPGTFVWIVAERLGVMEGRQLAAMGLLEVLYVCTLGWRLAWAFSAPLLYLFFLVPFGAFITPALQRFTLIFTDIGLYLLGIPYYIDRFIIEIPEGTFYIAEACAGLRFLIAAIAFGVLYACVFYRNGWKRLAFIGASCIVPIVSNGIRALGIVVAGHLVGSSEAAAADHVVYGWIFFSVVILILILAGLPFRDDTAPTKAMVPPITVEPTSPWLAATIVLLVAGFGPGLATAIDLRTRSEAATFVPPSFVASPECIAFPSPSPHLQRFACGTVTLTASVQVFPPRANPALLVRALRTETAEDHADETRTDRVTVPGGQPRNWRLAETQRPDRSTATALWIDGNPDLNGLAGRLRQARNSILGTDLAPVLIAVSADAGDTSMDRQKREQAGAAIRTFLEAQGNLQATVLQIARDASR